VKSIDAARKRRKRDSRESCQIEADEVPRRFGVIAGEGE
jgi:hypothetical protein